jgi:hypothetical protein
MKDVKGGTDLADCVDVMSRPKGGILESLNTCRCFMLSMLLTLKTLKTLM